MSDIVECSFQVSRYMQDHGHVGQGFVSVATLATEVAASDADFSRACDYLVDLDYCNWADYEGRYFAPNPKAKALLPRRYIELSLASLGLQFVAERLRSRMNLTADAEQLVRYLCATQSPTVLFVSEAQINSALRFYGNRYPEAAQILVDEKLANETHNYSVGVPFAELSITSAGRSAMRRNFALSQAAMGDSFQAAQMTGTTPETSSNASTVARSPAYIQLDKVFANTFLENEQEELLYVLVEAARNVSRDNRQKFYTSQAANETQAQIMHQGLSDGLTKAYYGDIEILANAELVSLSRLGQGSAEFDVSPRGFKYYEYRKQHATQPTQHVAEHVRTYLDGEPFKQRYPSAYQKWAQAEALLWSSDTANQLTTIGHLCREAMQEFATILVDELRPPEVDPDPARTVSRIRTVLDIQKDRLGTTVRPVLDALLIYWGTICDLTQRQEHGAQKEGALLVWEDGRRVVFQTAIVMFEVSAALALDSV